MIIEPLQNSILSFKETNYSKNVQQVIYLFMEHTGLDKMSFNDYWKSNEINPFFIMQWGYIIIYGLILFIVEYLENQLKDLVQSIRFQIMLIISKKIRVKH